MKPTMRAAGGILAIGGVIAAAVGFFLGAGALFSWNGRHPISSQVLGEGVSTQTLAPVRERRYTVAVQVVFDRESASEEHGSLTVAAKMPLSVRVRNDRREVVAETSGWLEPMEPPTVLYGGGSGGTELVAERLVGPFLAARTDPYAIEVDLGPDRTGVTRIVERRLVVYDDAVPEHVRRPFLVGGAGVLAFFAGLVLLVVGYFRSRRNPADPRSRTVGQRRGDNRPPRTV